MNITKGQAEDAIFEARCNVSSFYDEQAAHGISLDHHLYNHLNDCWIQQASQQQPFLTFTITMYTHKIT